MSVTVTAWDIDGLGENELILQSHTGPMVIVDCNPTDEYPLPSKTLQLGQIAAWWWDGYCSPVSSDWIVAPVFVLGGLDNQAHGVFHKQLYWFDQSPYYMIYNPIVVPRSGDPWTVRGYVDSYGFPHLQIQGDGLWAVDYGNYSAPPG